MGYLTIGASAFVKTPCRKCKDRNSECHCTCERYSIYRDRLDAENTKLKASMQIYKFNYSPNYRDGWGFSRPETRKPKYMRRDR